jgi:hypothetical protein
MEYATATLAEVDTWGKKCRTVTLTNDEWSTLTTYLLMSTKYRTGERDAWRKLAAEVQPDGTPRFQNAASNAEYWDEAIATLDRIGTAIDER